MSGTDAQEIPESRNATPRVEAGYIGDRMRPQFAWLHRPGDASAEIGLVIVPPFGYEAVCSRRALRHLGEDAAKAGVLAVRVDPDGTGNSVGSDLDSRRLQAWISSVHEACDLLRSEGATRIVLVGVRLGAMVAALAGAERQDVCGLVAIAAVTSGKAWLRECRMLQMSLNLAADPHGSADADGADMAEVVGFALTGETREALAKIDLSGSGLRPADQVLLIERNDMPLNKAWSSRLAALGIDVRTVQLPGYAQMVLDPHHAKVPRAIIDATIGFAAGTHPPPHALPPPAASKLRERVDMPFGGRCVAEEAVALDPSMSAIVSWPRTAADHAVILLNAGAIGNAGPNRLYVELARRLADSGHLVMRLDISGIADSPARAGQAENTVYGPHAISDVGMAVEWVRAAGARRVSVAGLCSGAYHALKAALAGKPIDRIIVINPLTFNYVPGMPLDYSASRLTEEVSRYAESVKSTDSWKKLLRGEVNLPRLVRVLLYRTFMYLRHKLQDAMRWLPFRLGEDLGRDLLDLARRGVAMHFVFAASDPGHTMLREQGGSAIDALLARQQLQITVVDGPDHTFTARWTHEPLLGILTEALGP